VLQRLLAGVVEQVQQAQHARGERPLDEQGMERLQDSTLALIDTPEQKRVLWVDDNPGNNLHEAGVLAKLQIDVVTERSTDEAMRRLATDVEGFDLVISDWDRPAEGADAGLRLLQRLRAEGHGLPVIYYHGAHGAQRAGRARRASAAGALGEAVLPGELMALVRLALQGR
jgi:DNA-binding NtrC family response regulator